MSTVQTDDHATEPVLDLRETPEGVHDSAEGHDPDPKMLFQIYVNDHRAGAAGGIALVRRALASNLDTPLGDTLSELLGELEEDSAHLDHIAHHYGLKPNPLKRVAAQLGEKVARLKLNGQLRGYSPLSRVIELEGLMAGIDAKHKLWTALRTVAGADEVGGVDLAGLADRAESQRERLVPHHRDAVIEAFGLRRD